MAARPNAPMCLVALSYTRSLDLVDVHRPAHQQWIETQIDRGLLVLAGRRDPPTGGFLLFRGEAEEVTRIAQTDPFVIHSVATFEAMPFTATLAPESIGALL